MRATLNEDKSIAESFMSFGLSAVLLGLFIWAYAVAQAFEEPATAQFPVVVLLVGIPLVIVALYQDARACGRGISRHGGFASSWTAASQEWGLRSSLTFFGYLLAIVALAYTVGQLIALPIFVAVYTRRWGKSSWRVSFAYAAACFLVVWGLYAQIMNLHLHTSMLFGG